jgi:hypothetical protein
MAIVLTLSQIIIGVRDLDAAADRFRTLGFDVLDGGTSSSWVWLRPTRPSKTNTDDHCFARLPAVTAWCVGLCALMVSKRSPRVSESASPAEDESVPTARSSPGAMAAVHANGARGVTHLTVTPRDADRFLTWTAGADVPLRVVNRAAPGLWNVGVETDRGELLISG